MPLALGAVLSMPQAFAAGSNPSVNDDLQAYLFTYFTGNHIDEEAICFAVSNDGYNFRALNGGKPVLDSKKISSTGGMRDPHILRAEKDSMFYMVATDMACCNGWDSNRAMVLMKSPDLINWSSSVVNIQKKYPNQENLKRVWAPQTIFDKEAGKYMIYWSMKHGNDGKDIIYYAYANPDFTDIEGQYKPLFLPRDGESCIDGDIVEKDGTYYMFYKTEGHGNGIRVAKTKSLTSGKWEENDQYKQQTDKAVEGAGTFKLNNQDKYILMYDVYMNGKYQFTETEDLDSFKVADHNVSMDFHPRHGTVLPITGLELRALTEKYGTPQGIKVPANPVLPGWHADPEILAARDGKYYIYSTTDGTPGWGGTAYSCFSSTDLKHWTDEGVVLDVATDQVPWADGNLWAPAAIERTVKGKTKYFLYYSAKPVGGERKQIGVAVADSPTGPFVDLGRPLITTSPAGHGQVIDVDVFVDPATDKPYIYWGNGYMAGAELNSDMTSLKKKTIVELTPKGGTLKDYNYREAPYVFYRNGTYYFMWSVDDTGSPNYHVAYGTAASPLSPITVAKDPIVLIQDPAKQIYGPAHNAVLKVPGKDEWYIVYHLSLIHI